MLPGDDRGRSRQYPTTATARKCGAQQHALNHWYHVYEVVENADRGVYAQRKNDLDRQYEIVSILCLALRTGVHRYYTGIHFFMLPCTGHS
jgi:hypothetical protein